MHPYTSPLFRMILIAVLVVTYLLISGCASRPCQTTPPLPSLNPRPVPQWQGKTYRDLLQWAVEVHEAAEASEADKRAARAVLK